MRLVSVLRASMMPMVRRNPAVASRELLDRVLVATADDPNTVVTLRGLAAVVWNLVDEAVRVDGVGRCAADQSGSTDEPAEVAMVLEQLIELGFLERA